MLSAPVPAFTHEFRSGRRGEAGGRGVWGEFRPPSPASSVRIFSNRHRRLKLESEIIRNNIFKFDNHQYLFYIPIYRQAGTLEPCKLPLTSTGELLLLYHFSI